MTNDSPGFKYSRGDALRDLDQRVKSVETPATKYREWIEELTDCKFKLVDWTQVYVWSAILQSELRKADTHLDSLLVQLAGFEGSTFGSLKTPKSVLKRALDVRSPIRVLEIDCEEFLHVIAHETSVHERDVVITTLAASMSLVAAQLDRVLSLARSEIRAVQLQRITAFSVFLSVVATVTALCALWGGQSN